MAEGDYISVEDACAAAAGWFPAGEEDLVFGPEHLSDGRLYVGDVLPGAVRVLDSNGELVLADQSERLDSSGACVGTLIDLRGFQVAYGWRLRYARGPKGEAGTGEIEAGEEILKCAMAVG